MSVNCTELPSCQGSLLKVVLDDYLRLKKLFAARLVTKSTSQGDHSSVSEVGSEGLLLPLLLLCCSCLLPLEAQLLSLFPLCCFALFSS